MDDDSYSNVIDLKTGSRVTVQPERRKFPAWQIAAGVAVTVLIVLVTSVTAAVLRDRSVETGAGEWRSYSTVDGSSIRVGPHTLLRFDFGDNRRFVHLAHGEAYFDVAKDAARPFVVETGTFETRAIGTRFAVTRRDNRVVVTVQEGSVAVQHRQGGADISVPVSAGQQLAVSRYWPVQAKQVDVERALAWTEGKLIFGDGDTVDTAVTELNYRNNVQLVVEDAAIGTRVLNGVFRADDPEAFAKFLEKNVAVRIVRDKSGLLKVVTLPREEQEESRRR